MLKRAITKCYLIPIQSFSDIITNSSSETYIVDTSYTAKALEEALEAVHKEHEDECDENGTPFESKEDYVAWIFEVPLSVAKGCLVVRVDYGYSDVDKFLTKNFKCIASDHERVKDADGRIVKD